MTQTSADAPHPAGPLAGIRIVEIVGLGPGPFAAMLLADMGAEVIRVDRPGGNPLDIIPASHDIATRNRRSVAVDLKSPRGAEVVLDLVASADALIEGFRPGVAERLGIGPEACLARNPALVYGRMTGWGQDGPWAQTAGHDITYVASTGALDAMGDEHGPGIPLNLVGDFGGGSLYLVSGVLAALLHARSTGQGQVVDAAIVDGVASLMAMPVAMQQSGAWDGRRGTNILGGAAPFYGTYATSDDKYVAAGPIEPQFWAAFVDLLGGDLPDRADASQHDALAAAISERFAARTQAEWAEVFAGSDACVVAVSTLAEAYEHPHLVARGTYVEHEGLVQPAPAPRFSATPTSVRTGPVLPGADTRDALTDWGIADVDGLLADGVVVQG